MPGTKQADLSRARRRVQWTGFVVGPVLGLGLFVLLPETYTASDGMTTQLSPAGRATAAVAAWMAIWWMTEAIPVYATALLPIVAFPLLGVLPIRAAAAPYAHELIFLFMGGFMLGLAMQRWGLHKRLAFSALRLVGTSPRNIVAGFMLVSAVTSMWVTNTATTIMMLPIALSVIKLAETRADGESLRSFQLSLLLGIAYAASIGGIGTLVGTAPNIFLASFVQRQLGVTIGFVEWMTIGIPLVIVFVPLVWLLLVKLIYPIRTDRLGGSPELLERTYRELGSMTRGEWITLGVFMVAAFGWILRPLLVKVSVGGVQPLSGLTDAGVAVIAALLLFVLPVDLARREFVIDWPTAVKLPWGLLLLFGGGLSLAGAIDATGVSDYLGSQAAGLAGVPGVVAVVAVVAGVVFLTELTSNTATTATLVPILAAVAPAIGLSPFALVVPATMAASCAFMLPVATPPNAIVFGSGYVTIPEMARAGVWMNFVGIIVVTMATYLVALPLLGVSLR